MLMASQIPVTKSKISDVLLAHKNHNSLAFMLDRRIVLDIVANVFSERYGLGP